MRTFTKTLMILVLMAAYMGSLQAQTNQEEFLAKWENSKAYVVEIVEAMPEDKLDFKPVEDVMSFREMVAHIAGSSVMMSNNFLEERETNIDLEKPDMSKSELKDAVAASFDFAAEGFKSLSEEQLAETIEVFGSTISRRQALALIDTHMIHHRGNLVVYLRLNGIKPPQFRAW